jgi:NADP-dependent 3-hydroxy acid dehydrogenase YdfG
MRTAMVTGASSGIGAATARLLSEQGYRVVLAARRVARLEQLAAELPGESLVVEMDVTDEARVAAAFAQVADRWGGVDVLINNAGMGTKAPLTGGNVAAWRQMLEVNVLGLCVCTHHAVAQMRARGDRGHVVHVSSMAAHRVPPGSGMYSATKYAVRSLTEGLRQELRELGSSVRVTAVSPGFVETEFASVYNGGDARAAAETYGRYKVLESEDVARAVLYVLSQPEWVQVHDVLMRPTEQPN